MSKSLEQRIEQWEQMCREAPDDLAWFSLGNAYTEAERHADAALAFKNALEHNPRMSRAWLSLGDALQSEGGKQEEAIDAFTEGYKVAAERGDYMPKSALAERLSELGVALPEVEDPEAKAARIAADDPNAILDRRTGTPQPKLEKAPMRGPIGAYIQAHFGQDTWREWIGMGTKVINELRLDFSLADHQNTYEQQMLQWLGITQEDIDNWYAENNG